MNKKGFTLLELLVVVLIIGILAAIALPQYQMAVGKSKFAELKSHIKTIYEAEQRYYYANDAYPTSINDLDVNFNTTSKNTYSVNEEVGYGKYGYSFKLSNGVSCNIWYNTILCERTILGDPISLYAYRTILKYNICAITKGKNPLNRDTKAHRLCELDTGKAVQCNSSYCFHRY